MKSLIILGRQPALGLAELESLYGAKVLKPLKPNAVYVDLAAKDIEFNRLGGSVKLTSVLDTLITTNWRDIARYLEKMVQSHLQYIPKGSKFRLGISTYGLRVRPNEINATALSIKKVIKAAGQSVRIIPSKGLALNSAQVLHNKLGTESGWEIVLYRDGPRTVVALTMAEQNIEAYAARDQNRPRRDAKVGMLPPKLAQIILNLATGDSAPGARVLDPFCGTGVVLQEALLSGYKAYGTDIEPRMIEYSRENIDWLLARREGNYEIELEPGDATTHHWKPTPDVVAGETFLGKPLSREPSEDFLKPIIAECDRIHRGFLDNAARQLPKGTRLCLAVPAWRIKNGFKHLRTLDYLRELGYNRMEFRFAGQKDLIYFREDQFVARELVVLVKN